MVQKVIRSAISFTVEEAVLMAGVWPGASLEGRRMIAFWCIILHLVAAFSSGLRYNRDYSIS